LLVVVGKIGIDPILKSTLIAKTIFSSTIFVSTHRLYLREVVDFWIYRYVLFIIWEIEEVFERKAQWEGISIVAADVVFVLGVVVVIVVVAVVVVIVVVAVVVVVVVVFVEY
jgi:hypothetical protein